MIRYIGAVVTVVAISAVPACGRDTHQASGRFDENGVDVDVTIAIGAEGDGHVVATFAPDKPGFHLYSVDLPADGVQGLGRPTEVAVTGGLSRCVADRSPRRASPGEDPCAVLRRHGLPRGGAHR